MLVLALYTFPVSTRRGDEVGLRVLVAGLRGEE